MASHTSDDTTRVVTSLRSLVQALRAGAGVAEERTGLSVAQLFVLTKLAEGPAPSVNALAGRVHAHQSSVSVVVDALVAKGLVRRTADPGDRRRRLIALTLRGQARLGRAPDTVQSRLVRAISALPRARRARLAIDLERVVRTLGVPGHPALFLEDRTDGR